MEPQNIECCWLTLTRECQARCGWCYARAAGYEKRKKMPFSLAQKLIDIMSDSGTASVVLIGGEPTLYEHFFEVVKYVQLKKMKPTIVTNGFLLADEKFADAIKRSGVDELIISVKSFDDVNYRKITGVKNGMTLIQKAVNNCHKYQIGITFTVTVSNDFVERVDSFLDALLSLKPRYLDFGLAVPVILKKGISTEHIPDPITQANSVKIIQDRLSSTNVAFGLELNIPFCLLDTKTLKELRENGRISRSCHIPNGTALVINEEGFIMPCNFFTSQFIGKHGVDFSTSKEFKHYWHSDILMDFRKKFTYFPHERCQDCTLWSICGGGCAIRWLCWRPADYIPGLAYAY